LFWAGRGIRSGGSTRGINKAGGEGLDLIAKSIDFRLVSIPFNIRVSSELVLFHLKESERFLEPVCRASD
jgi:hypothetical protein